MRLLNIPPSIAMSPTLDHTHTFFYRLWHNSIAYISMTKCMAFVFLSICQYSYATPSAYTTTKGQAPISTGTLAQTPNTSIDAFAQFSAQLNQTAPVLRAEFIQTKNMAALTRPLHTSGKLVTARGYGVLWKIEQPYRVSYVISETSVVEIDAHGNIIKRNLRDVPGLAQVARILHATLSANITSLQEYFTVTHTPHSASETWQLTPRTSQLAQFLSKIHLSGTHFIQAIQIDETQGDSTFITLQHAQRANTLTASELQQFSVAKKE